MTLYRQMLLFTCILFITLFTSAWIIKLESTRTFLQEQLESHAQDTATSLGLSLSPHVTENDLATVETMVSAVFDRGYYRTITLRDLSGNAVIERRLEVVIDEVPSWFIAAIPLVTPEARTLITSGWQQMGHLAVESHPGYAYRTLWQSTLDMTKVFGIIAVLVLASGALALRLLLRPLQQVERQAEDLCKRQYSFQTKLPRTRELRRVVVAMNSMTRKIKQMFDEQAQIADQLRTNAYSDPLTGLGNRRYLEGQVAAGMGRVGETVKGAFLLVQVNNLLELNQTTGYEQSDQLLIKVADSLRTASRHLPNAALARISGSSFAIFLPESTGQEGRRVAGEIARSLDNLTSDHVDTHFPAKLGHVGGVSYDRETPLGQLLSIADMNLSTARNQGANGWVFTSLSPDQATLPRGEQEWLDILDQVLQHKAITLFGQGVATTSDPRQFLHLELFARIFLPSGERLSAGVFIPMAVRLQRIAAIDTLVVEKALQLQTDTLQVGEVAVNISASSLRDASFGAWVISRLKTLPKNAPRIIFEFTEFNATQDLAAIQNFAREVKALGHFIGLDHFGQSFANFGYLKTLQPRYLKIDRAFTDELKIDDSTSHFFIASLANVAHSLDIPIIAEGVEEERQLHILKTLNIDGLQGYLIDKPGRIPE